MFNFSGNKKILCPYCLTETHYRKEISKCPACSAEFPPLYIEKADQAQPCFAQIIGWSQVGKTVFLQSLTLMLSVIGRYWRQNYNFAAQTDDTLSYMRNINEFLANGTMPPRTTRNVQDAYIMGLYGMERWGSRTLVMRDVAGESFNKLNFPIDQVPYLMYVPTVLMMVSIRDMEDRVKTMDQLMNGYFNTLLKNEKVLKDAQKRNYHRIQRKVVVVMSKADLIFNELPSNLQNYLQTDPFSAALDNPQSVNPVNIAYMQEYMDKLGRVSEAIRDYVDQDSFGHNMIQFAKDNNILLRYSMISSTGKEVGKDNTLGSRVQPMRVLDPFFWTLELQSK
jgi:hypothetical protein